MLRFITTLTAALTAVTAEAIAAAAEKLVPIEGEHEVLGTISEGLQRLWVVMKGNEAAMEAKKVNHSALHDRGEHSPKICKLNHQKVAYLREELAILSHIFWQEFEAEFPASADGDKALGPDWQACACKASAEEKADKALQGLAELLAKVR